MRLSFVAASLALLAACGTVAPVPPPDQDTAVLLLGEQHDVPEHQRLQLQAIESLAGRGRLAAVLLEMAESGTSTAGLLPSTPEPQVREALRWNEQAWPWEAYGPAVLAAVRAGVPVLGANLPREQMRQAMGDAQLDSLVPPAALQAQQQAIRRGHCDLLPATQIGPMTRVQIARDRAMAQALAGAAVPGKTVVLLAGAGHVDPQLGVPLHLPANLSVKPVVMPYEPTGKDYCADLRRRLRPAG
jgi:uncharacterized iron-regulated protein